MSLSGAQARMALQALVRDFSRWGDVALPETYLTPVQCRQYLIDHWAEATRGDPSSWQQGGWKRDELESTLHFLRFDPLPFA